MKDGRHPVQEHLGRLPSRLKAAFNWGLIGWIGGEDKKVKRLKKSFNRGNGMCKGLAVGTAAGIGHSGAWGKFDGCILEFIEISGKRWGWGNRRAEILQALLRSQVSGKTLGWYSRAVGEWGLPLDGLGGCLVERIDDGGLDKDLSPGNEEERLRRYSEISVSTWWQIVKQKNEWRVVARSLWVWEDKRVWRGNTE